MSGLGKPVQRERRGAAAIIAVVLMVVVGVVFTGMVLGAARHHDLTVERVRTAQAFYAAEAGMNMAMREIMSNADDDGDGTIGSISDDDDDATDPDVGVGAVVVTLQSGAQLTVTSTGRAGNARRALEVMAE